MRFRDLPSTTGRDHLLLMQGDRPLLIVIGSQYVARSQTYTISHLIVIQIYMTSGARTVILEDQIVISGDLTVTSGGPIVISVAQVQMYDQVGSLWEKKEK